MTEVTAATQIARGLKCDPPRRALDMGLYNLNGTRPASAEELTSVNFGVREAGLG